PQITLASTFVEEANNQENMGFKPASAAAPGAQAPRAWEGVRNLELGGGFQKSNTQQGEATARVPKPPLQPVPLTPLQSLLQPLAQPPMHPPMRPLMQHPAHPPLQLQPPLQPLPQPKRRRYRVTFTQLQLRELEAYFQRIQYPDVYAR
ncbi:homeobox protein ESX1, partial [Sigmodon hispidus]